MSYKKISAFEAALILRSAMGSDVLNKKSKMVKSLTFTRESSISNYYLYIIKKTSIINIKPLIPSDLIEFFILEDIDFEQKKIYHLLSRVFFRQSDNYSTIFSGLIYLGWNIINPPTEVDFASADSGLDGSLIRQSYILYNGNFNNNITEFKAIEAFISDFFLNVGEFIENSCLFEQLGKRCIPQFSLENLSSVSEGVLSLKRNFCFFLGNEIFTSIQIMLSPQVRLTDDLYQKLKNIFFLFRCHRLYRNLLLLRTIAGETEARARLLDELQQLMEAGKSEWIRGNGIDIVTAYRMINGVEGGILQQTILKLATVYTAITAADVKSFVSALADLQASDAKALHFVNWTQAQRMLDKTPRTTPLLELAAGAYFLSYCHWKVHPVAATNKGQGNFIAKLSQAINDTTRFVELGSKIDELCRRVARLPKHQAKLICEYILRRDILRLLPYFGAPQPLQDATLTPKLDRQISHIRFQLAQGFCAKGIINEEIMRKYTYEELEYLKLLKFYENDRKGRVRIDWTAFRRELSVKLSNNNGTWYKGLILDGKSGVDKDLVNLMAEEIAVESSKYILFESDNSLDWCLSNHIRHGHIVSTFIGAVHQAIDEYASTGSYPVDINPSSERYADASEIRRIFGPNASTVNHFIKEVVRLVDIYKDSALNFDDDSYIDADMTSSIKEEIVSFFQKSDKFLSGSVQLQQNIIDLCNNVVDNFLYEGRQFLREKLMPELLSEVNKMKEPFSSDKLERSDFLLHSIQEKLNHAADSVDAWLHQNQSVLVGQDFKLRDIANYLMATVFSSYGKDRPPQFTFVRKLKNGSLEKDPDINGAYFDFFVQIIFNAMQNAFMHSGLGRKTSCKLEVKIIPNILSIKITSALSKQEAAKVRENFNEILRNAQNVEPSPFAHEGGSGIAKIKRAAQTILNASTKVQILPMSSVNDDFVIEYHFPVLAEKIISRGIKK